ncbi:MAG TPA: hypothetical protein PLZ77_08500 [Lachnospiraceae bacterium]|nr:hypothetical protein [Lachnospiraceae bacterium]
MKSYLVFAMTSILVLAFFAGCGGSEESSNNTHDAVNISDGTNADDLSSTDDSASQGSENNLF